MTESSSPSSRALSMLESQYHRRVDRVDDLDLGVRASIVAAAGLAVAELGLLAFSDSRPKKIVGALAPVVTLAVAGVVDNAYMNARYDARTTANVAIHVSKLQEQPAPDWAQYARERII